MRAAVLLFVASCGPICTRGQTPSSEASFRAVDPIHSVIALASNAQRTVLVRDAFAARVDIETLGGSTVTVNLTSWDIEAGETRGPSPAIAVGPSSALVAGLTSLHPDEDAVRGDAVGIAMVDGSGAILRKLAPIEDVLTSQPAVAFDGEEYVVAYVTAKSVRVARCAENGAHLGTHDVASHDGVLPVYPMPLVAAGAHRAWIAWPAEDGVLDFALIDHGDIVTTAAMPVEDLASVQLAGGAGGALLLHSSQALPLSWTGDIGAPQSVTFTHDPQLVALADGTFAALDESPGATRESVAASVKILSARGEVIGSFAVDNYRVALANGASELTWVGRRFDDEDVEHLELRHRSREGALSTQELDETPWEWVSSETCSEP